MRGIDSFLSKFQHLTPPKRSIVVEFCAVVRDELRISLEERFVRVRNGIIHVSASGPVKHLIFSRQRELLEILNQRLRVVGVTVREIR